MPKLWGRSVTRARRDVRVDRDLNDPKQDNEGERTTESISNSQFKLNLRAELTLQPSPEPERVIHYIGRENGS